MTPFISSPLRVAVIGGGWAGCAAAVTLAQTGKNVTLFEAAKTLGGRARRVDIDGKVLDNGQHILLGAYSASLEMMELIGVDTNAVMRRLPLQIRYHRSSGGIRLIAPRLPAPFHLALALIKAKGMPRSDKLSLMRFFSMMRLRGWQLNNDCTVNDLLARYSQSALTMRQLWGPLCIAALNTPPERASAQVFLNVLRDSLGAHRTASDMLLPRTDLSALLPTAAAAYVEQASGRIETGVAVKRIERAISSANWRLHFSHPQRAPEEFDRVIVATPPEQAAALLSGMCDTYALNGFFYEPITTCYLQYTPHTSLKQDFYALLDDGNEGAWGQYVFDRGRLDASQAGLLAVVVSSAGNAIEQGQAALIAGITQQLARTFRKPELAAPLWSKVISEKRATFACSPGLHRPAHETAAKGIFLAGDYTASDYPATLETAVRSGIAAARLVDYYKL